MYTQGLLVFGNPGTLKSNEVWAGLLGHIEAHGALPADSFAASVLADVCDSCHRAHRELPARYSRDVLNFSCVFRRRKRDSRAQWRTTLIVKSLIHWKRAPG